MAQQAVIEMFENDEDTGPETVGDLVSLAYDDLRAIAHRQLRKERQNHTLGTTALVNEAYLKLFNSKNVAGRGGPYFFASVARAMREILVDYARQRNRVKRGGGLQPATLTTNMLGIDDLVDNIIDIDEALKKLETRNPRCTRVIECRFFSGLSVEETAIALNISPRTVKSDWSLARAWLFRELGNERRA